VHDEAALLPFHINTLAFRQFYSLPSFLPTLLPSQRGAIRYITVVNPFDGFKHELCERISGFADELSGLIEMTCFSLYDVYRDQSTVRKDVRKSVQMFHSLGLKNVLFYLESSHGVEHLMRVPAKDAPDLVKDVCEELEDDGGGDSDY
jgi:hypothetical protein